MSIFLASLFHGSWDLQQVTLSGSLHKWLAARAIPPSVYKLQVAFVSMPYALLPVQLDSHSMAYTCVQSQISTDSAAWSGLLCALSLSSLSSLSSRITRSNKWLHYDRDSIPSRSRPSSRCHHAQNRILHTSHVEFALQIPTLALQYVSKFSADIGLVTVLKAVPVIGRGGL
jgi:hypothetical protein